MFTVCVADTPPYSLHDRMSQLLESPEWCDCSFRVGSETIRAHKLILAISSPVFKAMLYGPMFKGDDIVVPDIEPDIFRSLLNFIYKDGVRIESLECACGLLYAAKKYMLPSLVLMCLEFIDNSLSVLNVMTLFNFSEFIQEDGLSEKCLDLICKHAGVVLENDREHVSAHCLRRILRRDSINASEAQIIKFTVDWTSDECLEQKLRPTRENRRILLAEIGCFELLRFRALSAEDAQSAPLSDLLFEEELSELREKLDPATVSRSPIKLDWLFCYRPEIRWGHPLTINVSNQSVKVRVRSRRTVFVSSVSIPARQSSESMNVHRLPAYKENLNLTICSASDDNRRTFARYDRETQYNSRVDVELPKPFIFIEEQWYILSFTWPEVFFDSHKYPLCYRAPVSPDDFFVFDDSFDYRHGGFVEGFKFCI